jgi:hypothetical protein
MNELDEGLAQRFSRPEVEAGDPAFVAAVRKRITRERRKARAAAIGLGIIAVFAAVALTAFAPETALYPVHTVQRWLSSPLGAAATALGAIALVWWTRFGEI